MLFGEIENLSAFNHPSRIELIPRMETNGNFEFLSPKRS